MRLRNIFMAFVMVTVAGSTESSIAAQRKSRPTPRIVGKNQRFVAYRKAIFAPRSLVMSSSKYAAGYGIHHSKDWSSGGGGLGKYVGAHLGQHLVKNTLQFGIASCLHENDRFVPSGKRGVFPRLGTAVEHTFYVPRTTHGKTPAYARVGGSLGAGMISSAWFPGALHSVAAGATSGGMLVGADVAGNVVREFWPDIRKRMHRSKS